MSHGKWILHSGELRETKPPEGWEDFCLGSEFHDIILKVVKGSQLLPSSYIISDNLGPRSGGGEELGSG